MKSAPRGLLIAGAAGLALAAGAGWWWQHGRMGGQANTRELLARYCVDCHNPVDLTAGLAIDPRSVDAVPAHAEQWEKVVRKLRAQSMPPEDPRPRPEVYAAAATYLETELDALAAKQPVTGDVPAFRRLTRTEYRNAIRDLLAIDHMPAELDFELLLPADNASSGFDNIADLLFMSPVVMERYLAAAQKIARLAVGDVRAPVMVNTHQLSEQQPQDERVDELSFGTRGGLAVRTYLPLDAEYTVDVETARPVREPFQVEVSVDGVQASVGTLLPRRSRTDPGADHATFRVPIAAGPHLVGITFIEPSEALDEALVRTRMRSRGTLPAIAMATIRGPFAATGPGNTPSRERIFVCRPAKADEESACAQQILTTLATRAYRRPVTEADIGELMPFFASGREENGFEAGVQLAIERLLMSPQFLYRIEETPPNVAPGTVYAVSDLELASRLSFFLWSSVPDDELLKAAVDERLHEPTMLRAQVERMLADPRSESMVTNFAAQWLYLRDVVTKEPDIFLFPDQDRKSTRLNSSH